MNRRGFLALLAGAVLDPEKLLWVPGRVHYSIPPALQPTNVYLTADMVLKAGLEMTRLYYSRYSKEENRFIQQIRVPFRYAR